MMSIQLSEGTFIVDTYQAAVASYIRHQDCHKSAFDLHTSHSCTLPEAVYILPRSAHRNHIGWRRFQKSAQILWCSGSRCVPARRLMALKSPASVDRQHG